uniref:cDNA FLJ57732, moderately similar to Homo sapiens cytochrome b5 reductase 1 (CYB5R1), mRNA n=1 Tax=Homo sapiens TaxID=9606 RepID=B4DJ32_HUMAN|nr:unnamed protein product [Homo sapiens]
MGIQTSPVLLASLGVGLVTLLGLAVGSYLVRRSRRPQVTLLDPNEKYLLRLLDKTTVSHNTKRFRFALPTAHHTLGLPVAPWDHSRKQDILFSQISLSILRDAAHHRQPLCSSLHGPQANISTSPPELMAAWSSGHTLLSPVMRIKAMWILSSRST